MDIKERINKIRDEQHSGLLPERFPQDVNKMDPEVVKFVQKFLDTMFAGKECPHCHKPLEKKEQVGTCVYGVPCGCRLYHGSADLGTEEK